MKIKIKAALKADGIKSGDTIKSDYFYRLSQEIAGEDPKPINKFWAIVHELATRDSASQDCDYTIK